MCWDYVRVIGAGCGKKCIARLIIDNGIYIADKLSIVAIGCFIYYSGLGRNT